MLDLKELLSGPWRGVSASPGLPPLLLASMIFRCCSRTLMLRSSCSRIDGSWVLKPGERHASPTSCSAKPALSLDVSGAEGRAESAPPGMLLFEVRLRRLGRCLGVGSSGEPGSFLTTTFGIWGVRSLAGATTLVLLLLTQSLGAAVRRCQWGD